MLKVAFAGASGRGTSMYFRPIAQNYTDVAQPVGIFDVNPLRCAAMNRCAGADVPVFTSFDEMIGKTRPDVVVVTTVDRTHDEYAVRAMELGCDVILEKPMATDARKIKRILDAERSTGRKVTVTFNLRYVPFSARLKRLVLSGAVGEVYSVHFEWTLDTRHGADYFRRWHRYMRNSGGLLVHKATHHFDLVNWLIDDAPKTVSAFGALRFYGAADERRQRSERCLTCPHKDRCGFYFDIKKDAFTREFYLDCESADGYHRDGCVFAPDIDIVDTASVSVKYKKGALMSYSLNAHALYEGYRLVINGGDGRIEADCKHGAVGAFAGQQIFSLKTYGRDGELSDIRVPADSGAHGGGDSRLLKRLLLPGDPDPLFQMADTAAGAASAVIGAAANASIATGKTVSVDELMKG